MDDSQPIVLIPPDDRPDHLQGPVHLARLAGRTVALPPRELLGHFKTPGQPGPLGDWLRQQAGVPAFIVAADMLAYGGLLAAHHESPSAAVAQTHLSAMEDLKTAAPETPILVFSLLLDASQPERIRARNQALHQRLLEYLGQGTIDYLLMVPEDHAANNPALAEQAAWKMEALKQGAGERLNIHPGMQAAAPLLLTRAILQAQPHPVRMEVRYAHEAYAGEELPETGHSLPALVEAQAQTAGIGLSSPPQNPDIILFVNSPHPLASSGSDPESASGKTPAHDDFAAEIARHVHQGFTVALADVALPSGTDPLLLETLSQQVPLLRLAAYAGGPEPSNNVGRALAQGCLAAGARSHAGAVEADQRQRYSATVFRRQFQKMAQLLQAEKILVLLRDKNHPLLTPLPVAIGFDPAALETQTFGAETEFWSLALTLQSVRLETEQPMDLPGSHQALADLGARNGLMVSLLSRGFREDLMLEEELPMGLLCVLNKRGGTFTEEDETLLVLLARQTSAVLRNMRRSEEDFKKWETAHWRQTLQSQQRCLLMRFIEDWGYQTVVRPEIERQLPAQVSPEDLGSAHTLIESLMREQLQAWAQTFLETHWCGRSLPFPSGSGQARLPDEISCHLSFPWPRTSEIQVDIPLTLQVLPEGDSAPHD